MTNEKVSEFIDKNKATEAMVKISFKLRSTVKGVFIQSKDFEELGKKNLWRIVTEINADNFKKTKDINLCRIFNGAEFTRLELA